MINTTFDYRNKTFKIRRWGGEELPLYLAVDTETNVVENLSVNIPDLSTFQFYGGGDTVYFVAIEDIPLFLDAAKYSHIIVHNVAFDFFVIDKALGARFALNPWVETQKLHDTQRLYQLVHLAEHGYVANIGQTGLGKICNSIWGVTLDKDGEERMGFGQFIGKPIEDIPTKYLQYAATDVVATYDLFHYLKEECIKHGSNTLLSENIQVAGAIGMAYMIRCGIGFDLQARNAFVEKTETKLAKLRGKLANWGLIRGIKGFNTAYKAAIDYIGLTLPLNDDGTYSQKEEHLRQYRDKYAFIDNFLTYMETEKMLSFVSKLTTDTIHARYDLLKNTGRTGCASPNMQNLPRAGGIREMFIPTKKGNVFVDIDYSSLELATLAQVCYTNYGKSEMRELINSGECLHYNTASDLYEKEKEFITKEERQFSKIPNFGFPANMSPRTFVDYCKGYGVEITEKRAKEVKSKWTKTYPEMKQFWDIGYDTLNAVTLTGRKRGDCTYTAFLNTQFQGLASDGAKIAMYYIAKEGYHLSAFIHDQFVVECGKEEAQEVMDNVSKIMIQSMRAVCPDVRIEVEGQIIERFTK